MYPEPGSNRHGHCWPQDFKSGVSTYFSIRATFNAKRTSPVILLILEEPHTPKHHNNLRTLAGI